MAKFKRKTSMRIKKFDEKTYIFKNGVAVVPGCFMGRGRDRKPMTMTMKEFNEVTKEIMENSENA